MKLSFLFIKLEAIDIDFSIKAHIKSFISNNYDVVAYSELGDVQLDRGGRNWAFSRLG
jgi:hypothetical protein